MKFWLMSNKEFAEQQAFNRAIGYLQAARGQAEEISVDEILSYMRKSAKEICENLNERFPEYAEQ